jgi:SAM-dependent methyltransferase
MPELVTDEQDCPACGETPPDWGRHTVTDRYGWTWRMDACRRCGVQYQARPMTAEARRDFYGSGRYRQLCAAATGDPWDDPTYLRDMQQSYAYRWLTKWDTWPPLPGGHWLDYGGSTGVVSAAWGWHKQPTVTVADYGDGATTTPEQALAVPDGTYDAILCCQTLDHLRRPLATLERFKRVAKPGAKLFVDVVKQSCTAYKLDHDTYYLSGWSFLRLIERSGWTPLWLDAETHDTHYAILAVSA